MHRTLVSFTLALAFVVGSIQLPAQGEDRAIRERNIERSLRYLDSDQPEQRIFATYYLSSTRAPRFLRPLGRALIEELNKDSLMLNAGVHDPYVKAVLARGMGRFGQPEALPYLSLALKNTSEIIEERKKRALSLRAEERKFSEQFASKTETGNESINEKAIPKLVLEQDRPGPAQMRSGHSIPFSPDVHWSVSDEFKATVVDPRDGIHRMRLKGYNYVNVAVAILDAYAATFRRLGEKLSRDHGGKHVEQLSLSLKHDYPAIRSAAARALGQIGNPEAISALEGQLKSEKDSVVRVNLCRGVLSADKTRTACYLELVELLKTPEVGPRYEAASALRDLAFGESLQALQRALRFEEDSDLRKVLLEAISRARVDSLRVPADG